MNSKVELTPEERATKAAIEKEIENLYGYAIPFTSELKGDQYNVTLETEEVIVLTANYINSLKENL